MEAPGDVAATRSVCDFAAMLAYAVAAAAAVGCGGCYCDGPLAAVTLIVTDLGPDAAGVSLQVAVVAAAETPEISVERARWRTFCSCCHRDLFGRRSSVRRNSCTPEEAVAFSDD